MKSKEEIEQLANKRYLQKAEAITDSTIKGFIVSATKGGFIDGYNQCQEDMGKLSEWQLCPKCFGEGIVQNVGTSSSMYRTCPVCNGNKTLIKPII